MMNNDMNNMNSANNLNTASVPNNNVPSVNYTPTPQVAPENKNGGNSKLLIIIISIIAVVAIVLGVFFLTSSSKEEKGNANTEEKEEGKKGDEEEEKHDDGTQVKLHTYDEYQNYAFTMDLVMEMQYSGSVVSVKTYSEGKADVKNKTDYMVTTLTTMGETVKTYSYNDLKAGYTYSSEDQKTWTSEKITAGADETIELEDIINKINSNDPAATKQAEGHYKVKAAFEDYNDVYAEVYFDSEGWITRVYYDLSAISASEGISKLTVDIKLSNYNQVGDVVIPQGVAGSTSASA